MLQRHNKLFNYVLVGRKARLLAAANKLSVTRSLSSVTKPRNNSGMKFKSCKFCPLIVVGGRRKTIPTAIKQNAVIACCIVVEEH